MLKGAMMKVMTNLNLDYKLYLANYSNSFGQDS